MLNKLVLIGNLGRDPEMNYTPNGKPVTRFSVAVNRRQRNRETGELSTETQWFSVVAWDSLAETCQKYLHKGSKVYIEGSMTSRKYLDKDGVERTVWEVVLAEMAMLDRKADVPDNSSGVAGLSGSSAALEAPGDDVTF